MKVKVPHIPEPGEPLETKEERRARVGLTFFVVLIIIWTAISFFMGISEWLDVLFNGPYPLREGYIPKAYRVHDDVKVLPKGADPSLYIKQQK